MRADCLVARTAIRVVTETRDLTATMPCSHRLRAHLELQALQQRIVLWAVLVGLVRPTPISLDLKQSFPPGSASGRRPGRCDAGPALYRWRRRRLGGNCADL